MAYFKSVAEYEKSLGKKVATPKKTTTKVVDK
jgi:hypothetical protein